ncbi:ATP-binding protein [Legionella spiritensis]|uniref:ATP-dependent DNA helicase n=1 Tax=Legionella spiritensis TaxID=452 RepID=A0A0W0Z9E0_LEGSP|nr:ATP-binding protein [Legionella spiritensis]KTD65382.1 ATP-dependent DNA helicase [Legionella spiritensis]SNV47149.1 ATP-dependent DNA helicase [Legionella spiritensis]
MSPEVNNRSTGYYVDLINELRKLPSETEWLEFKHNNADPEKIGEYCSALVNSALLLDKPYAYIVWGIDNNTHDIIGTTFKPDETKIGNEALYNWLTRLLSPKINFHFISVMIDDKPLILLEAEAESSHPIQFKSQKFIRIGSYKKKLSDHPEKEKALWRVLDKKSFEDGIADEKVSDETVLKLLDYPAYFDLLGLPVPDGRTSILNALQTEKLILPCEAGGWNITTLGAVLFAKNLVDFLKLKRKALRIIHYKGNNRIETQREHIEQKGYAVGFEGLIDYIMALIPTNEVIGTALRKTVPMYPELAIRELVANALTHQDFKVTGAGPMIEIFDNRIEITNPGLPLVSTERFLDTPPKSRNEALASLMRRFGICEERGSGIDKVVSQIELYQLPAPIFEAVEDHTRVVLFAHRELKDMDKQDRIWACYLHACLRYVERDYMTNSTLRDRFGIAPKNSAMVSRIIRDTLDAGKIRCYDDSVGSKAKKYLPWWVV